MELDPASLDPDPFAQLAGWLAEAEAAALPLANAFALATASDEGEPSVRMVLLRGLADDGLRFYTNRTSRKGRDLAVNPRAAATFWWPALDRQVRAAGPVRPLDDAESTAYWQTRPPASRLSAWASEQGAEIDSRSSLEAKVSAMARRFGPDVPLPPFWGGYLLAPRVFEFWASRADRLHDRVEYLSEAGGWRRRRLQP